MSLVNAVATTPQINTQSVTPATLDKEERIIVALEKISKAVEKPPAKPQKSAYWKYVAYTVAALATAYFAGYPKAVEKIASSTIETVGTAAHMAQEIPSAVNLAKDAVDSTLAGAYYVGVPLAAMREKVYSSFNMSMPPLNEREVSSLGATFVWKSWIVTKAIAVGSAILAPVAAIVTPVFGRRPVDVVGKVVGAGAFFYTVWQTAVPNEKINQKIAGTAADFVNIKTPDLKVSPEVSSGISSVFDTGLSAAKKVANFAKENISALSIGFVALKISLFMHRSVFPRIPFVR